MAIISNLTNSVAIKAIEGYQQYLSPIKGFKCAAGQIGGQTCSGAVKSIISTKGVVAGVPAMYKQFASCHHAAKTIASDPNLPITTAFCCIIPIPL